ncbi:MAG: hypothetical protein WDN48_13435 [Pseudolabrys sp.]
MVRVPDPSAEVARGFALAAVREMAEETGLLLGKKRDTAPSVPGDIWAEFAKAQVHPDLAHIHFIARAITPPKRPKRFDTRFFTADATAIAHKIEGIISPDAELVELVWIPIAQAAQLDMPTVTGVVLEELAARVAAGMAHSLPVPFYYRSSRNSSGNCCNHRKNRHFLTFCGSALGSAPTADQAPYHPLSRTTPWPKPPV